MSTEPTERDRLKELFYAAMCGESTTKTRSAAADAAEGTELSRREIAEIMVEAGQRAYALIPCENDFRSLAYGH